MGRLSLRALTCIIIRGRHSLLPQIGCMGCTQVLSFSIKKKKKREVEGALTHTEEKPGEDRGGRNRKVLAL